MNPIKSSLAYLLLASFLACPSQAQLAPKPTQPSPANDASQRRIGRWLSLWNEKDLTGWHLQRERGQHGSGGHWTVTAEGALCGEQDPPGSGNGGLLLTDQSYSEFELELSLRPDWGPDSGVFVRTDERGGGWQIYVDHHDHGNVGHIRLETKPYSVPFRPWGFSRTDPKQPELTMAIDARTKNWPEDVYEETCTPEQWLDAWNTEDWNQLRIRVTGGDLPVIETWINGLKVCRLNTANTKHPQFDPVRAAEVTSRSGAIGLQVHGGKNWRAGDRVYWKDLRIRKIAPSTAARATRTKRAAPADLVKTPLVPAKVAELPDSMQQLDIYLLMGQSNMKGRGVMPAPPLNDVRILMMHKRTDGYFHARHPLHLTGSPEDFSGADNAGVGPGIAFAQSVLDRQPKNRVLLVPCAVGGTAISKWQKGQRLYEETIRRAKLAVAQGPAGKTRIAGALWLQGEADSGSATAIAAYAQRLDQMINDLRTDLELPELPFIACTIGELKPDSDGRKQINAILLDLPNRIPMTACVDSRSFAASIGDEVHFDTPTQNRHGNLYATEYFKLQTDHGVTAIRARSQ